MAGRDGLVPDPAPVIVLAAPAEAPSWSSQAAATKLDPLATKGETALGPETEDAREAWEAYEHTPEVNQMVSSSAGLLSQCHLYAGWTDAQDTERHLRDEDGTIEAGFADVFARAEGVGSVDQFVADCEEAMARRVDQGGSQRGLLLAQAENWDVTGDGYMVRWLVDEDGKPFDGVEPEAFAERWEFVSRGAIGKAQGRWTIQLGGERAVKLPRETTIVYRMWRKHPRRPDDARGWVRAALDPIRDLRVFTMAQRSAARSTIPAKILVTASEASPRNLTAPGGPVGGAVPPVTPAVGPAGAGALLLNPFSGPGGTSGPGTPTGQPLTWAQTLERLIGDAVMEVLRDAQSGRAVVPAVLSVSKDFVDKWHEIDLSRPIPEALAPLVDQARERLAESADCPPEMLRGLGETNRWNGAQIADDEYRRYFRPKAMGIADAWTVELLWGDLLQLGWTREQCRLVRCLVDARGVVAEPDRSKLATEGLKLGAIGYAAWRRECGFTETDAPTPEELQILQAFVGRPAPGDQAATGDVNRAVGSGHPIPTAGRELTPPAAEATAEEPPAPVAGPAPAARRASLGRVHTRTAASTKQPLTGRELAEQLTIIEQTCRTRLEEAAEAAFDQAINRGGAKLKTWARADQDLRLLVAGVENHRVAEVLGADRSLRIVSGRFASDEDRREDMFAAALLALLGSFTRIAGGAYTQALGVLGARLSDEQVTANIAAGSENLRASMLQLADQRVFAPTENARPTTAKAGGALGPEPAAGELSMLRVPSPVTRRAMAAAGGSNVEPGTGPLEQANTGLVFGPTLAHLSPPRIGFEWVYGEASTRRAPWEPHESVDGQVFSGPDDPGLAGLAPDGGPGFPGDHDGCQCDWQAVFREEGDE